MIKAGKNKKAPFCAYGDDSHFNEVLGILSQSCLCPMKNEPYVPTPEQCEIYASIDKTRIKFIGKKKNVPIPTAQV
jgi:hypothetical protein